MVVRRCNVGGLVLATAVVLVLAGCSDDTQAEPKASPTASKGAVYVGTVDASRANIGLVSKDNKLAGMVCQDARTSLRLDAVPVEDGKAELMADGKSVGTVSLDAETAVGTVDFDGSKRKFHTEPATGEAGVYRLAAESPDDAWDGWVVLNDGSYTGTSKSKPSIARPWIDPDSQP